MAKGATFTSVWARCPNHQTRVLEPDEEKCFDCQLTERNLSLPVPFDVYCTEDTFECTKEMVYTVQWVVTEGREEHWKLKGYGFEAEDGSMLPHIFDPLKFIPVKYLTDDHKDSLEGIGT